jgi:hypothetical protein
MEHMSRQHKALLAMLDCYLCLCLSHMPYPLRLSAMPLPPATCLHAGHSERLMPARRHDAGKAGIADSDIHTCRKHTS